MDEREKTIDFGKVFAWWGGLIQNRGERAELRRAHTPTEALLLPQTIRLVNAFSDPDNEDWHLLRVGAIAGVMAHVRENVSLAPAMAMAMPKEKGGSAPVSEARFRRLLACAELDELYPALIRTLRLLDQKMNVSDLSRSIYFWNRGVDRVRRDWALRYYSNLPKS